MKRRVIGTAGVAMLAALASCSHNPPPQVAAAPQAAPAAAPAVDTAQQAQARRDSAATMRADSIARVQAHADSVKAEVAQEQADSAAHAARSGLDAADSAVLADRIHFDYNKSDLKGPDEAILQQKLALLQGHPQLAIQIAGNCDERGSEEYNLALGERRAAAAKRWLVAHGIAESRISTISYGEERPLDPAHNEEAWAKNRRDDFTPTSPAQ
jgi:peptidoglycan-associated lipoprotein